MMDKNLPFKFCPSCEEEVYSYPVQKDGEVEIRCSSCGFPLCVESRSLAPGSDYILISGGDRSLQSFLAGLLAGRDLAANIVTCKTNAELLTSAAECFRQGVSLKLAILDVTTSSLDGISTGLALRAVEKGLNVASPTLIAFLSAARSDDALRKLINRCRPALSLNKGSAGAPEDLGPRLERVIGYLFQSARK